MALVRTAHWMVSVTSLGEMMLPDTQAHTLTHAYTYSKARTHAHTYTHTHIYTIWADTTHASSVPATM